MEQPHDSLGMKEIVAIARRRKWQMILPVALILGVAAALAYLLPPLYRSEATLLIERQSIPAELIKTTVTGYVQEQIEAIRQRIVTHENLMQIAEEFDLYPGLRQEDPVRAVDLIRKNIEVAMVDVEADKPSARGGNTVTIAFTVGFRARSPEIAQAVAKQLAARYLEENRARRNKQAADVTQFLTREAGRLQEEIAKQESALAKFKQEHLAELPELMSINLKLYEKTEQEIDRSREAIRALKDRADTLAAELSLTSPFKAIVNEEGKQLLSAAERLSQLTAEYLRESAKYSAEHPNILRMRHEISLLAGESGAGARTGELLAQLVALQEQMAAAQQRYSEAHPTVKNLRAAVAAVEKGLRTTLVTPAQAGAAPAVTPDNPRYVALKTQLNAVHSELRAEEKRHLLLQQKLVDYERRLFQTPIAERDFKSLSRDYANDLKKFEELKEKLLQARLAEQLEAGDNAERFVLADEAWLPLRPESPNRLGILLLGGLFALLGGIGFVAIAEYMDDTARGQSRVAAQAGTLAVIPHMAEINAADAGNSPRFEPGAGGTYQLVFQGEIVEGFEPAQVKAQFGRVFKLTADRLEKVFSRRLVVFHRELDWARATRYQTMMSRLGLKTSLRPSSHVRNGKAAI